MSAHMQTIRQDHEQMMASSDALLASVRTSRLIARADISTPLEWGCGPDAAAHFTLSGARTDDGTPSAKSYWQPEAHLIGLTIGATTFDRATTLAMVGADLVDEWEAEAVL